MPACAGMTNIDIVRTREVSTIPWRDIKRTETESRSTNLLHMLLKEPQPDRRILLGKQTHGIEEI